MSGNVNIKERVPGKLVGPFCGCVAKYPVLAAFTSRFDNTVESGLSQKSGGVASHRAVSR